MDSFEQIYQFKIELNYVSPAVWRRIQVPETYSFWDLHVAIQDSMGWKDCHLHEFQLKSPKTGDQVRIGIPDEADTFGDPPQAGWEQRISSYFSEDNPTAIYCYDFGDGWEHNLTLEGIQPREPKAKYPRCLEGAMACPPEDCGGPPGYEDFLAAISDPKHEAHEDMLEWIGGSFDAKKFNAQAVKFDNPKKRFERAFS